MSKNYNKLHTFIGRLVKELDSEAVITAECKDILNQLIRDLAIKYITSAVYMCRHAKKATIDSRAIIALTKIWVSQSENIVEFAHTTWDSYSDNKTRGISKHKRANLSLPPARVKELFSQYRGANQKIGEPAYIFLTALLESIFSSIITKALEMVRIEDKVTLRGMHIYQALMSEELDNLRPLFRNTFVAGFGTI